jgi:glutathione S-transferase
MPASSQRYLASMLAAPAVSAWMSEALAEHDWVVEDEPYRTPTHTKP